MPLRLSRSRLRHLLAAFLFAPFAALAADSAPTVVKHTLLEKLNHPVIYILVACSMLIVWLVLDGFLNTSPAKLIPSAQLENLRKFFRQGDYQAAYKFCQQQPGTLTNVVGATLKNAPGGQTAAEDAAVTAISGENARFQNKIAYLSVIGVIAPMIGLAGTVFGMIEAFAAMGQAGAADPSKLSGAIGEVLYSTASGLCVAIPAFVFYYLLRNRTAHAIHHLHAAVADLFRKFPYEHFRDFQFTGGEHYAALPKWLAAPAPQPEA